MKTSLSPRTLYALLLVLLMVLSGLSLFPSAVKGKDLEGDLIFNSNSDLYESDNVTGSGSYEDPYVIENLTMNNGTMSISSTNAHLVIKNIVFPSDSFSSSDWAITLDNVRYVTIWNVECTNWTKFLYVTGSRDILVENSVVNGIGSSGNTVLVSSTQSITFDNCTFSHTGGSQGASFYISGSGQNQQVTKCDFHSIPVEDDEFGGDMIDNNTFENCSLTVTNGDTISRISDNTFSDSEGDGLIIRTSYGINVNSNVFKNVVNGTFIDAAVWGNTQKSYLVGNRFESCKRGFSTKQNYQVRVTYWTMVDNFFGNCTREAINLFYAWNNQIYHNAFYMNNGKSNTSGGSQVSQTGYSNQWTVNDIGNFWSNHQTPDDNNDGIVDIPYDITSPYSQDTRPYTNFYFDTTPPNAMITNPSGNYFSSSYLRLRWDSFDEDSGTKTVKLRVNSGRVIDLTNLDEMPMYLKQGVYIFNLTVEDRAGLYNRTFKTSAINRTTEILTLDSPQDGAYIDGYPILLRWTIDDNFPVENITVIIDEEKIYLPTTSRGLYEYLEEGVRDITVSVRDDHNLYFNKSLSVTVDRTSPEINVLSPSPNSTISNPDVNLRFEVSDNFQLDRTEIRIDDGEWEKTTVNSRKILLSKGPHTFRIRAFDNAGHSTLKEVPFRVGGETGISILNPRNGTITSESRIPFEWEYNGTFGWTEAKIRVDKNGVFVPIEDMGGNISLDSNEDHEYEIVMRLMDPFDNFIEESITVIKDVTGPSIGFTSPAEGSYLNDTQVHFRWAGSDTYGIREYFISLDEAGWLSVGDNNRKNLSIGEGPHNLSVRAVDLAGNTGENRISFTIDKTKPTMRITQPNNIEVFSQSRIIFEWEASDNFGVSSITAKLDDDPVADITYLDRFTVTSPGDGDHKVIFTVVDNAGNSFTRSYDFIVDTRPPVLRWIEGPGSVYSSNRVNISFEVQEEVGLNKLDLKVGNRTYEVNLSREWIELNLTDGSYDLILTAVDMAGMKESIDTLGIGPLIIDTTSPFVEISLEDSSVLDKKAYVYWMSDGTGSDVTKIEVYLDGELERAMDSGDTYNTGILEAGAHTILVGVYDEAGNYGEDSWAFEIEGEPDVGQGDDGSGSVLIPILIAVAIVVIGIILLLILVVRKRRRKEEERMERLKKPSKPQKLTTAPIGESLPNGGVMSSQTLPGQESVEEKVEDREDGTGYIRPKKKKKRTKEKRSRESKDGEEKEEEEIVDLTARKPVHGESPWEEEKRRILEEESQKVFVGQQSEEEPDHGEESAEDTATAAPSETTEEEELQQPPSEEEIPIWGAEDVEEFEGSPEDVHFKSPPSADDIPTEGVLFDEDVEEPVDELEELEELDEFEDLEE